MENKIQSKDVLEAMEQVRMGFTASRIALGACTLLYPLKKLGEKWGKKFTKIQSEYHKFLLDTYTGLEEEYNRLLEEEKSQTTNNTVDTSLPQDVINEILDPKNNYKA